MMSLARRPSRPRIRLIVLCTSVAACAIFQPDWRLAPSVIGSDRPTLPAVDVPDTLTAGVPATVTAWTKMGWEGCERPGTARVTSDDLPVTIRLFDSVARRGENEAGPRAAQARPRNGKTVRPAPASPPPAPDSTSGRIARLS